MIRIIISDELGQHGLDIKTAISNGYGSDISDQIQIIGYWSPAFNEARDNENIAALIRSTQGVASYVQDALSIYPRVQTFFPLGGSDNIFELVNVFQDAEPPVIVCCGAGDFTNPANDKNNTSYGNGLEFWDRDLNVSDTSDESSYSNGYVLGKLLKIKDTLNCTWWEARYRARMRASRIESNRETSLWDLRNGYGKIDEDAAIAYVGLIPTDQYIAAETLYYNDEEQSYTAVVPDGAIGNNVTVTKEVGEVVSLVSIADANEIAFNLAKEEAESALAYAYPALGAIGIITISNNFGIISGAIEAVDNAAEYNIYKNDVFLMQITGLSFVDVITASETVHRYKYKAVLGAAETAFSSAAAVYYPVRKIIGFYKDTETTYGEAKAASIKNLYVRQGKSSTVLMNIHLKDTDIVDNNAAIKNEAKVIPEDDNFLNTVYRHLKANVSAYNDLGFIYEEEAGLNGDESMSLPKKIAASDLEDGVYYCTLADRKLVAEAACTIVFLDAAKTAGYPLEVLSQTMDDVIIKSEIEGQLIAGLPEVVLNNLNDSREFTSDGEKYLLM